MRTKVFKSGNSKAVRLPAEIAFDVGTELEITRTGDVLTIFPTPKRSLRETFALLSKMPRPREPLGPIERTQVRLTAWDREAEAENDRVQEFAEPPRSFEQPAAEKRDRAATPRREEDD